MRKLLSVACLVALCLCGTESWAQSCTATLSWTPPSEFDDGSPLDPAEDLSGYNIYVDGEHYGANPTIGNPTVRSYIVSDLPTNGASHDFTMTAVGKNGLESDMSNSASKACPDMRKPKPPSLLDALIAFVGRLLHWIGGLV